MPDRRRAGGQLSDTQGDRDKQRRGGEYQQRVGADDGGFLLDKQAVIGRRHLELRLLQGNDTGNRTGEVFRLIVIESTTLGLAGGIMGVLLGAGLAWGISSIGIPMPPPPNANMGYTAHILIVPSSLLTSFLVGFGATVMAVLVPARRVTRIPVVDALRQNI